MAAGERCRSGKAGITGSFCPIKSTQENSSYLFMIRTLHATIFAAMNE
jgi:hypothetical protein